MKTNLLAAIILGLVLPLFSYGQSNFYMQIFTNSNPNNINTFLDGQTLYIPCANGSNAFDFSVRYYNGSAQVLMSNLNQNTVSAPGGYVVSNPNNDLTSLHVEYSYPQDGNLTFTAYDGGYGHTFTFRLVSTPTVNRDNNVTIGNNQSGTLRAQVIDQYGNSKAVVSSNPLYYTSVNWQTQYGLYVNGSQSYSTGNTGMYNTAPVSTINYGGKIYVTATNGCGTSAPDNSFSYSVGTPYLVSATVNGSNGSSATVVNTAYLALITDNTATSANWTVTNGSGSISPSGVNCTAYPNNFLRIVGTPTNSNGSGQEATFYIMKQGNTGYRMTSSNPAKEQVSADFDDPIIGKELLTDFSLIDEKGKVWRKFDFANAAKENYFEYNKGISFPVNDIPSGTYYLHIKLGDKLYSERILL